MGEVFVVAVSGYCVDLHRLVILDGYMENEHSPDLSFTPEQAASYFVQRHFANLKPVRTLVAHIDPAETTIVTYSELLQEAVLRCIHMQLPELPAIVLIDSIVKKRRSLNTLVNRISLDSGAAYNLRILALNEIELLGNVNFCLFSPELDGPRGLWSLCESWLRTGHREAVMMDVKPLLNYPQLRIPGTGFLNAKFADICEVYHALSDAESCDIFLRTIKSSETGNPGYLIQSPYAHYQHPLVKAIPGDTVIEGGSADGKTTVTFAGQVGSTGKVIGFEPLGRYITEASIQTQSFDNVVFENLGLWSDKQVFHIEDNGEMSKLIPEPTATSEECRSIDLDSYLAENGETCDLIKLDIEGAETECLKGAIETIRKHRPKLQISIYHRPIDYINIPLMLIRENLDYDFYMGHHLPWFNETVIYAYPRK
jgi:FkbM family methyltransferase